METHRVRIDKVDMTESLKTRPRTLKVILDSNALFVPLRFKIDIFEDLKTTLNRNFIPVLIPAVKSEIEKMAKTTSPRMRKEAAYALKLTEKCRLIKLDEEEGSADDVIVKAARKLSAAVFTNDTQLRKRLRNINVPVIYVRQKSHLKIDGRL
jgi:rRNA-processing protein FCF1